MDQMTAAPNAEQGAPRWKLKAKTYAAPGYRQQGRHTPGSMGG